MNTLKVNIPFLIFCTGSFSTRTYCFFCNHIVRTFIFTVGHAAYNETALMATAISLTFFKLLKLHHC